MVPLSAFSATGDFFDDIGTFDVEDVITF